jgi:hypothetical protein
MSYFMGKKYKRWKMNLGKEAIEKIIKDLKEE